jgi:hypothetical protein
MAELMTTAEAFMPGFTEKYTNASYWDGFFNGVATVASIALEPVDWVASGSEAYQYYRQGEMEMAGATVAMAIIPGVSGKAGGALLDLGRRYGDDVATAVNHLCSFSADTLMMTEDGLVPMSEVTLETLVLAYNEETGEIGYYPVIAIWSHEDPVLVFLTIDGETIVTTPNHPFFTDEDEWKQAANLQPGDEIRDAAWGTGTVEAITFTATPQTMYNFTVAAAHTYFVGDGQWLVHNQCPGSLRNVGDLNQKSLQVAEQDIQAAGFTYHNTTSGGYIQYRHADGARIWIRPNGEVIRLGLKTGGYRPRYDYMGNPIGHNSGEFIIMP